MGIVLLFVIVVYAICLFIAYMLLGFYIAYYDLYINSLKNGLWGSAIFIFLLGILICRSEAKILLKKSGGEYGFAKIIFDGLIKVECAVGFVIILLSFFWRKTPLLIALSCGLLLTLTFWLFQVLATSSKK